MNRRGEATARELIAFLYYGRLPGVESRSLEGQVYAHRGIILIVLGLLVLGDQVLGGLAAHNLAAPRLVGPVIMVVIGLVCLQKAGEAKGG